MLLTTKLLTKANNAFGKHTQDRFYEQNQKQFKDNNVWLILLCFLSLTENIGLFVSQSYCMNLQMGQLDHFYGAFASF